MVQQTRVWTARPAGHGHRRSPAAAEARAIKWQALLQSKQQLDIQREYDHPRALQAQAANDEQPSLSLQQQPAHVPPNEAIATTAVAPVAANTAATEQEWLSRHRLNAAAAEFTPVGVADNSLRETAIVGPEIKPYMKSTLLDKRMDRVLLNDPQEDLDHDDGVTPLTLDETSKRAAKKEKNRGPRHLYGDLP